MGVSVSFMCEARLGNTWTNIDFRFPTRDGSMTTVPILDVGSVGRQLVEGILPHNRLSFCDMSEGSKHSWVEGYPVDSDSYSDVDRWSSFYQIPGTWFVGRGIFKPQWSGLIEKNALRRFLADDDSLYCDAEWLISEASISPKDYAALPADAQKAYVYHELDDTDGTHSALRMIYCGMLARISAFNDYIGEYRENDQTVYTYLELTDVRVVAAMGW